MGDFLLGVGVALAIEGTLYALAPGLMQSFMRRVIDLPEASFRAFGLGALALGVALVWLARA
jgi:uncharacterized protein YjeT (DUF2065 family)